MDINDVEAAKSASSGVPFDARRARSSEEENGLICTFMRASTWEVVCPRDRIVCQKICTQEAAIDTARNVWPA